MVAIIKFQEDKIKDRRCVTRNRPFVNPPLPPTTPIENPYPSPRFPCSFTSDGTMPSVSSFITRRYSRTCEKDLCYNHDEKFSPNHCCKARFFLLIIEDDASILEEGSYLDLSSKTLPSIPPQISFNALSGHPTYEALHLEDFINQHHVTILIDGGSTYNFLETHVAKFLGLFSQPTTVLRVMVGNDTIINCLNICPTVPLIIQGHKFVMDLRVLPISGADVVLGV